MTLPTIITSASVLVLGILAILLFSERRKSAKYRFESEQRKKNHLYLVDAIKQIQNSVEHGKHLENVVDTITKNLTKIYPYSAISSIFVNDHKLMFKSQVNEALSYAFIDHVKDAITQTLRADYTKTESDLAGFDSMPIEPDSITGVPLDDLINSTILSTFDIKIAVGDKTKAIINISSTTGGLYKGEDIETLLTVAEIASGFLTRLEALVSHEKSKSLSMIDSFSEGIFMLNKQNRLTAINDSAQNFLNIHKEFPTINDVLLALPNTYNFKDKIEKAIAENRQIIEEDVPLSTKSFKIIITPVLEINSPEKNVIGASVLLHDTTLEKSLSQMKEDFTNIMVHELRSPLTAIKASSEFLLSQAQLTESEKRDMTNMISISSKKMLDEISLILDSAKMDAGLFAIRKTSSDLKKLIADRVAVFAPVAAEKTIKLEVDVDQSLTNFYFDPIRIDEVVNNLLSNSLKFTPSNGTINVTARAQDGKVSVSVKDTGEGVPKDKQHLLFSKFHQAPTGGEHVGTGLGLYVVKGVVEAHGGTVSLESNDGKSLPAGRQGTTITFTLPLTSATQSLTDTNHPSETPQRMVN